MCILGNRTISGHELDDSLCVKTISVEMREPEDGADANVTTVMGENSVHLTPAFDQIRWIRWMLLELAA